MHPYLLIPILGLTVMAGSATGAAIVLHRQWEPKFLRIFLALGAGFMLGAVLIEMVPHSFELAGEQAAWLIAAGYLIVHFFEHTITPHFHFGEETHAEEFHHAHGSYSVLIGLAIHNFFEGVAIASSFLVAPSFGAIVFLAIMLHKLPEGFTMASVMLASGHSRRVALWSALSLGAASLCGMIAMNALAQGVKYGLSISAGVTLYVAASDLLPEVNRKRSVAVALSVFAGVALMVLAHVLLE